MLSRTLSLLATSALLGCGLDPAGDDDDALAQQASATPNLDAGLPGPDSQIARDAGSDAGPAPITPPNAPFSAQVQSTGTGCATGVSTSLNADGETFEVGFPAYAAQVEDGQRTHFRDCNLTLKLRGAAPFSYAVTAFQYDGYATLEPNVRGFVTANDYTRGTPVPSAAAERRTDLTGPVDRAFSLVRVVEPIDRVWSPCGLDRYLQVGTRVGLQKTQSAGAGNVRLQAVKVRLAWRPCGS